MLSLRLHHHKITKTLSFNMSKITKKIIINNMQGVAVADIIQKQDVCAWTEQISETNTSHKLICQSVNVSFISKTCRLADMPPIKVQSWEWIKILCFIKQFIILVLLALGKFNFSCILLAWCVEEVKEAMHWI